MVVNAIVISCISESDMKFGREWNNGEAITKKDEKDSYIVYDVEGIETRGECTALIRQYLAAIIALLALFISTTSQGWQISILPYLLSDKSRMRMTIEEISWMVSSQFAGQALVCIPSGYLVDWIGRKGTLVGCGFLPITSWTLILTATNPWTMIGASFLFGLWSGIAIMATTIYLGEITEPSCRGRILVTKMVVTKIGLVFGVVLAIQLTYLKTIILLLTIPVLFMMVCPLIPESPYYHLMNDRKAAALNSLTWLRAGYDKETVQKEFDILESSIKAEMSDRRSFRYLLSTTTSRKSLLIISAFCILYKISAIGCVFNYITLTLPNDIRQSINPTLYFIAVNIIEASTGLFATFLIDSVGRKKLLTYSSPICGLLLITTGVWFFLNPKLRLGSTQYSWTSWIPIACLLIYALIFNVGVNSVFTVILSEYFPINLKTKSTSVVTTISAISSTLLNKTYMKTSQYFGMFTNFWIYGGACFAVAAIGSFLIIETSGKTLHEIQIELNKE